MALRWASACSGRPRALDLFCGAGGACVGLQRAGFDVTGIDNRPQPRYPGRFILGDALAPPVRIEGFDFVWASPPCQLYSLGLRAWRRREDHSDLIPATREMLTRAKLYTIENVAGAPLHRAVMLCGTMFGLQVFRHRLFESNFLVGAPEHAPHRNKKIGRGYYCVCGTGGKWRGNGYPDRGLSKGSIEEWSGAMGIGWMTRRELTQAIPPAYAEFIGRAALNWIGERIAAAEALEQPDREQGPEQPRERRGEAEKSGGLAEQPRRERE